MAAVPSRTSINNISASTDVSVAPDASAVTVKTDALRGAWWKWGTGLLMAFVIYGAFFIAKGAQNFGADADKSRIVFFHVPVAILSFICYAVATVYALLALGRSGAANSDLSRSFDADGKSAASMELGFLFCILTTITGSIFSQAAWSRYWNWDPSQTRIVMMLMLYASYLVLRGANGNNPARRARLSAVYTIVTLAPAFFLIWVVPRILETMHPVKVISQPSNNSPAYNIFLLLSFVAFNMLFVWLFQLRCRLNSVLVRRELARMQQHVGQ